MNMTTSKGMSQTLALIVAASVLMMTALTVIFLTQGSLGDLGQQSTERQCISTVNAQCQAELATTGSSVPSTTIRSPESCMDESDNPIISNSQIAPHSISGDTVTCNR